VDGNYGGQLAYVPNSDDQWADQPDWREPPLKISGAAGHWDHRVDEDHFEQPGNLFRLMSESQKQALFENTARSLSGVSQQVQQRHVAHCTKADPFYGAGVARALAELAR